ncbi:hypothetical protein BGZ51_005247 [Haplosporangium sp. Z 767]|nr:hypothetical protein BGZ51_005247 [Haplosporangium sp. Z 767]
MSDDGHDAVQAALRVPVVRLSDQLVLFCRSLVHDLTSKGYICSRDTKSRDQDALLVLFQQADMSFIGPIEHRMDRVHAGEMHISLTQSWSRMASSWAL